MAQPDPSYDLQGAITGLSPGLVLQRQLLDAAEAQYAANGYTPLTASQITAILADANTLDPSTLPPKVAPTDDGIYPAALPQNLTGPGVVNGLLPRFPDSNPDPFDGWVEYGNTRIVEPP